MDIYNKNVDRIIINPFGLHVIVDTAHSIGGVLYLLDIHWSARTIQQYVVTRKTVLPAITEYLQWSSDDKKR